MQEFFQQILNGTAVGAAYAVVALGFGLIFSVMRVINLAQPDLLTIGAYATYVVASTSFLAHASWPVAFLVVIMAGVAVAAIGGLIIQETVVRPLQHRDMLMPFLATAGVAIIIENGVQAIWGVDPVGIPPVVPVVSYSIGGVTITSTQLIIIAAALVILAAVSYYVRRTRLGLATRAVAERSEIAATCGVDVRRVGQVTVLLASASAGLGGVVLALLFSSATPTFSLTFGVKAFVVMLVSGNRHIEAIMASGLALGIGEALITGYVSSSYRDAVSYGILIAILLWRPQGVFGSYPTTAA